MIKNIIISVIIFLLVDFLWLGAVAKNFYDNQLSPFKRTLNWPAAILTYLLIIVAINLFVLPRASGEPWRGFIWGGLLGLCLYGVYDLTNWATLSDWSVKMVVVDMLWGIMLCGTVSALTIFISAKI